MTYRSHPITALVDQDPELATLTFRAFALEGWNALAPLVLADPGVHIERICPDIDGEIGTPKLLSEPLPVATAVTAWVAELGALAIADPFYPDGWILLRMDEEAQARWSARAAA